MTSTLESVVDSLNARYRLRQQADSEQRSEAKSKREAVIERKAYLEAAVPQFLLSLSRALTELCLAANSELQDSADHVRAIITNDHLTVKLMAVSPETARFHIEVSFDPLSLEFCEVEHLSASNHKKPLLLNTTSPNPELIIRDKTHTARSYGEQLLLQYLDHRQES